MTQVNRVIIAGAGLGGLTAALAMVKLGIQVVVCEQAESFGEVGAGLQMSPNAMKVLTELGLKEKLSEFAFAPQHAAMRDYKTGEYYLKSLLGDNSVTQYGAPYWHLHRADLHKVLVAACEQEGVVLELNAKILRYDEVVEKELVTVFLGDGRQFSADLLIGADGIRSSVREQMLGVENPTFTGQVAWRGTIPVSQVTVDIKPDACVWVGPNRHFVSYYIRGGEYINFVAVEERTDWRSESWHEKGDVKELRRVFSGWHPEVSELLECAQDTFLWALNGRDELPMWHQRRAVLLGDACHPMLPFMAQGAAMAIEDAYVLSQYIKANPLKDALIKYEKTRKPRATHIQKMSKSNTGLYHMHGGLVGRMKLKALQAVSHLAPNVIQSKLDSIYSYDAVKGSN